MPETGQHGNLGMQLGLYVLLIMEVPVAVVMLLHWVRALLTEPRRYDLVANDRYASYRSATEV